MLTVEELEKAYERVKTEWGMAVLREVYYADCKPMTAKEFLTHCTACGGNWGGMLLSGVEKLYPLVYDEIPEHLGYDGNYAFGTIVALLHLLKVDTSE